MEEQFKLDELKYYDRMQNLKFQGVPFKNNENVTHKTLDLVNKLSVDQTKKDMSITHRLPQHQRPSRTRSNEIIKHPTIIFRFLSLQKRNEIYTNSFKAKDIFEFPLTI